LVEYPIYDQVQVTFEAWSEDELKPNTCLVIFRPSVARIVQQVREEKRYSVRMIMNVSELVTDMYTFAAGAQDDGWFHDIAITLRLDIQFVQRKGGGWRHNDLSRATGAPAAAGNPSGYVWEFDQTQHIVYRGGDTHIHELWNRAGKPWGHVDLNNLTGAPSVASDPTGYSWEKDETQHIVYRGNDNHIHELWFRKGADWAHADLSRQTDAVAAVGKPVGYVWESDQSQHVIYLGADNHVHELWNKPGTGWNHSDLSRATDAPAAADAPIGYAWESDSTQHVIYRGADNHIHELWNRVGSGWRHSDLSRATNAPSAAGTPTGYAWEGDGTQHVMYRGTDGHIHELWVRQGIGWQHVDLSQRTSAPSAASSPVGYVWEGDGTQHVMYRGTDGHIHELWYRSDIGWNHSDLTALTSSPAAIGDIAGYAWEGNGSEHVMYCANDKHIHELWYTNYPY
jgi:hypothetical protein